VIILLTNKKAMKKYKTTSKQPLFKEGLIVKSNNDYTWIEDSSDDHPYDFAINPAIKNGWIEEIQEPEFTEDDMIDFANMVKAKSCGNVFDVSEYLKIWRVKKEKIIT
jgi:hypothetical protein